MLFYPLSACAKTLYIIHYTRQAAYSHIKTLYYTSISEVSLKSIAYTYTYTGSLRRSKTTGVSSFASLQADCTIKRYFIATSNKAPVLSCASLQALSATIKMEEAFASMRIADDERSARWILNLDTSQYDHYASNK